LSRFQKDNIIKVDGKLITILDFDRLNTKLAALNGPSVVCG
ncbi:MAG: transcriptional regulator FNR, partial [Pseudomonadota bacterium]|nr:transcriptional regulator FNR [Pseudomonadota bacterium]